MVSHVMYYVIQRGIPSVKRTQNIESLNHVIAE